GLELLAEHAARLVDLFDRHQRDVLEGGLADRHGAGEGVEDADLDRPRGLAGGRGHGLCLLLRFLRGFGFGVWPLTGCAERAERRQCHRYHVLHVCLLLCQGCLAAPDPTAHSGDGAKWFLARVRAGASEALTWRCFMRVASKSHALTVRRPVLARPG